ncbi:hypothetical protein H4R27_005608 [Coemansia aciculifera]|nr:hypothetical protein H4R27_005608 [Coemansia aciculifera]
MLRALRSSTIRAATRHTSLSVSSGKQLRSFSSSIPTLDESEKPRMNRYSSVITQPKSQGPSQAMLYGTGLKESDMDKAQVGISSVWFEGNPCNMHLLDLAGKVKEGVVAAGLVGMRFNTIGVSDGISMGTRGMCFSLQSRDLIADSIETTMSGLWYDANISIPGCDKNMPGVLMAMARLNRPSIMVYGGTIRPGKGCQGQRYDIVSTFEAYGSYVAGKISEADRFDAGIAKVFESEDEMLRALERGEITKGHVVIIRYVGPKGGPGMPEMLTPSSAIMGAGLGKHVALLTDGRFSGGSHGFIIGHITPEAQEGGPLGLIRDGDRIAIDAETRRIDAVDVSEAEMNQRRSQWVAPPLKAERGTLYKYIKNVKTASFGCVTDE